MSTKIVLNMQSKNDKICTKSFVSKRNKIINNHFLNVCSAVFICKLVILPNCLCNKINLKKFNHVNTYSNMLRALK